ncbi:MAG: metal ABC transporter substrate-binding protein [Bacteroidota bacterium]
MNIRKVITCCLLVLFAAGVGFAQEKKLKVITTLNYLRSITQEIGGDRVDVVALANPRQDPHYVTPTPRMNQITNEADLFIEHGLSLDLWSKNVLDASGNPGIQPGAPGHLVATVNVPVKELPTEVSRAWGDIHPQGNPHCWLDPLNVRIIAENIADRLATVDPQHAALYESRLAEFKNHLDVAMFGEELVKAMGKKGGDILTRKERNDELESWLKSKNLDSKLGGWKGMARALHGKNVVTYHKTYAYFADRFGFTIAAELEEKPGIPPPPQRRDAIVEQIKRDGVKVILNDNFYSREAADYVASKTSAKVFITYIDVNATDEVNSYDKLITYLLEHIADATK